MSTSREDFEVARQAMAAIELLKVYYASGDEFVKQRAHIAGLVQKRAEHMGSRFLTAFVTALLEA